MYITDLFDITITLACRPKNAFKLSFVEATPYKHQVLKAIDMMMDELKKDVQRAAADEDEAAEGNAADQIENALRAQEIVKASTLESYAVNAPVAVIVAGTQIGVIKVEQPEVWKTF